MYVLHVYHPLHFYIQIASDKVTAVIHTMYFAVYSIYLCRHFPQKNLQESVFTTEEAYYRDRREFVHHCVGVAQVPVGVAPEMSVCSYLAPA